MCQLFNFDRKSLFDESFNLVRLINNRCNKFKNIFIIRDLY